MATGTTGRRGVHRSEEQMPNSTVTWRLAGRAPFGAVPGSIGARAVAYPVRHARPQPVSAALVLLLLAIAVWRTPTLAPSSSSISLARSAPAPAVEATTAAAGGEPAAAVHVATVQPSPRDPASATGSARPAPDLYELAGARYSVSPALLRALHAVESGAAADGCVANLEGSGALGPFQFMPATFAAYGVDADGDGHPSICGFADSLFSAARYLQALGADDSLDSLATRRALERYGTDAALVLELAR